MIALINLYLRIAHSLEFGLAPVLMPLLARLVFAAVFLLYFWNSAMTKVGANFAGLYKPSSGAFAQILPKAAEAASYDVSHLTPIQTAIILAGTWGELLLPVMIVIGLFTRFAAAGMVVFVVIQTVVDIYGHGIGTQGGWFDGQPDGLLDQRALWIMLLLIPLFRGAGALSLDRLLLRRFHIY